MLRNTDTTHLTAVKKIKIYLHILENFGANGLKRPLESLSDPRQRRARERHQTKGLMSKTIAVHVHYKSLYVSLPSFAKQQREMTKARFRRRTSHEPNRIRI